MVGYFLNVEDLQTLAHYLINGTSNPSFDTLAQNLLSAATETHQDLNLLPGPSLTLSSSQLPSGDISRSRDHRSLSQGNDMTEDLSTVSHNHFSQLVLPLTLSYHLLGTT